MTESGWWPPNDSAVVRPLAFRPVRPSAMAPRTSAVATQTTRGLAATTRPTLAQNPRLVGSAEPNPGRAGQKIQRPEITTNAGSRVIIAARGPPPPIPSTGPLP